MLGAIAKRDIERLRHLAGDVGLHLKDVSKSSVESLLPLCRRGRPRCDPDQLGADAYPTGAVRVLLPSDGCRQQILEPPTRERSAAGPWSCVRYSFELARAMTARPASCDNLPRTSSPTPSAK